MSRSCLSATLRRTERLVTRHYDAFLEKAGITAVQIPILAIIAAEPEATPRLLTETLELERSTLSRNLTVLRRRGLLLLGPSSGPKPGLLTLTRKGRLVLSRAHQQWQQAHRELVDALDGFLDSGMQFLGQLRRKARGARTRT